MKIKLENLGVLRRAEFELGDMTIICGGNNTGKTYATYALYGFLIFWKETFSVPVDTDIVSQLLEKGTISIDLQKYIDRRNEILARACILYKRSLSAIFASKKKYFEDSSFSVELAEPKQCPMKRFNRGYGTSKKQLFRIRKMFDSTILRISLLGETGGVEIDKEGALSFIGDAIKEVLFGHLFPPPFIASAERTGAAIFRSELNFARNRLLEQLSAMDRKLNPFDLMEKAYSTYALPVRENVDFMRQLEGIFKRESFIAEEHPELLTDFANIIEGEYKVTKDGELYFVPKANKQVKLTMGESSSAVRSLLDIGFYLRHAAKPGDLLMVDEPELNLHPENQRLVARLFARLVNLGIKVFITTHSDYFIKELNTLIMLKQDKPSLDAIREREGYKKEELISADKIKVYVAEKKLMKLEGSSRCARYHTLKSADIDPALGIEVPSFDTAIDAMNRIQDEILFAEEA